MDPTQESGVEIAERNDLHMKSEADNFHAKLDGLHIGTSTSAIATDPELNPWQSSRNSPDTDTHHELHTPDPSALEPDATQSLATAAEPVEERPRPNPDVLSEFDPLASPEEKAAQEAWANAPSNPPPPDTPAKEKQEQPLPPLPQTPDRSASPSLPAFPSLAALARTFSIPLGQRRDRPRSLDTAEAVPSPATLSSFAAQQSAPPKGPEGDAIANMSVSTSTSSRSSVSSKGKEKDESQFDFQKFLDQMKSKSAEPVARYLRSFLSNFAKRTFTVNDQIKLINDFLAFIAARMRECDIWRNATDAEFDNAMEGIEKLVMNRLYDFTFTPQVARMVPPRPVTSDDLERDRVLAQRIALFQWIEPQHLDIPEGEGSEGFLMFAQQELLKVNHYKAPRDKLICILNCCKVIFGLLRHLHKDESADSFVPILIYIVLKANPPHLMSNVEFINRFRNPTKLQSEAGYYLSSLMGAVSFVETMDHTSLSNITQEEFEQNVEAAIPTLPASRASTPGAATPPPPQTLSGNPIAPSSHVGEESARPLSLPTPAQSIGEDAKRFLQKTGDSLSKPLGAISKIFNEVLDGAEESLSPFIQPPPGERVQPDMPQTPFGAPPGQGGYETPPQTPYKPRVRRQPSPLSGVPPGQSPTSPGFTSPGLETPTRAGVYGSQPPTPRRPELLVAGRGQPPMGMTPHVSRTPTPNLDIAGVQAEIDRATEKAATAARETLKQIFPTTDQEIMEWVLEANEGDLGKSIEALLEMSSAT